MLEIMSEKVLGFLLKKQQQQKPNNNNNNKKPISNWIYEFYLINHLSWGRAEMSWVSYYIRKI